MKKVFGVLLVALLFVGCKQKIAPADIAKINGYWEIEKVVFEDGNEKKYGANESYDYFQIDKKNVGIRSALGTRYRSCWNCHANCRRTPFDGNLGQTAQRFFS